MNCSWNCLFAGGKGHCQNIELIFIYYNKRLVRVERYTFVLSLFIDKWLNKRHPCDSMQNIPRKSVFKGIAWYAMQFANCFYVFYYKERFERSVSVQFGLAPWLIIINIYSHLYQTPIYPSWSLFPDSLIPWCSIEIACDLSQD